jgi:hypothetical protein
MITSIMLVLSFFIKKVFQRKKTSYFKLKDRPARQDLGILLDMPYLEHKEIYLNNLKIIFFLLLNC